MSLKNKIPKFVWILLLITAVGVFLRTYNLREWLYFYPDQARDAVIVEEVVNEGKSWPLMGAIAASTKFKIGPMYYYFQIISAKIFGTGPEIMVYPDLFFAILSIPLFYYFLNFYFRRNLSLALTGLYAVSFYMVEYSRFAWNPNPIPFFVLVFLISLRKFLVYKEKTHWLWIILIGAVLGISVQLHTLLLMLFPAMLFFVFVYLLWKKSLAWKKWAVIFAIAVFLNVPQIISEREENYANTKVFLKIFSHSSDKGQENLAHNIKAGIFGYAQANAHILTSLGDKLDFQFLSYVSQKIKYRVKYQAVFKPLDYLIFLGIFASVLFLLFGHWKLVRLFKKEKNEERKYFLGLLFLYSFLSFLIMLPIMDSLALRYFIHLTFIPFLFLGFLVDYLKEKFPRCYLPAAAAIFCFAAAANFYTIAAEAKQHAEKSRSNDKYIVLGEIERMRDFMISHAEKPAVYLFAEKRYQQNYFKPITYVMREKGYTILRTKDPRSVPAGEAVYMLGKNSTDSKSYLKKYEIDNFKDFGQIGIYKLSN